MAGDGPAAEGVGLFESLRRLGGTAIEIAEVRLDLLGSELEGEKLRLGRALALGAVAAVLLGCAVMLLSLAAALLFDGTQRLLALAVAGGVCAGVAAWCWLRARHALRAGTDGTFALSRAELRRDRDALRAPRQ